MYNVSVQMALRSIPEVDTFEDLLARTTLSDLDKTILRQHYLEDKDFAYIADTIGYSESGVRKRHAKAIKKLSNML